MDWQNITNVHSQKFQCGFCSCVVASDRGYSTGSPYNGNWGFIRICPHCARPTFMHGDLQIPGVAPGNEVGHLPADIQALYNESRKCVAASCYTASVLICRKLLINLAVSLKADPGKKFIEYVDYLVQQGYVPPNGRGWVDHIRKKGNEAAHEILLMSKTDAEELIVFTEMLLKFIYEFPAKVPPSSP